MKPPLFLTCLLVVILTSCSSSAQNIETTPTAIRVEVTRIVLMTTTPIPTETLTPSPTLDEGDISGTTVAEEIGTPIVASRVCYETAQSQRDLTACAGTRLEELDKLMAELLKVREAQYQKNFPAGLSKFQSFQAEWQDLADRECMFRSGLDGDGSPGTIAPMNYGECMVAKYEDRLRELQIQIFEWTN